MSRKVSEVRQGTTKKRYGVENPFASPEVQAKIRATNLEKYGVENPNQSPEVISKRKQTNLERYGVEHYFQTEEFKAKYGKKPTPLTEEELSRGVTCPYCKSHFPNSKGINSRHKAVCDGWKEVLGDLTPDPCLCGHSERSRTELKRHYEQCPVWQSRDKVKVRMSTLASTLQSKYGTGVTHPMLVPGAKDRQAITNKEIYGAASVFSRESSLFGKVQASLDGKRAILKGDDNPFSWPETQTKIRQYYLDKYGVTHSQQVPGIRAKTMATNLERYGSEYTLASPFIREKIVNTNMVRYGGPGPSCSPEIVEKTRQTNLERWGFDWTCQHPDVRKAQLESMVAHYGSHYFASEMGRRRIQQVCVERYGVPHPMQVPEIAMRALTSAMNNRGPNVPESVILREYPSLVFTGNGILWRRIPSTNRCKNPDFVVPGPDPLHPFRGVTKVIEHFGDYYHSIIFTGREKTVHEQEVVEGYASIGIYCLVIWESELKDLPTLRSKIDNFLSL